MLMVSPETFRRLEAKAKRRGVKIQELLRAVVIPEWLRRNPYSGTNSIFEPSQIRRSDPLPIPIHGRGILMPVILRRYSLGILSASSKHQETLILGV